MPFGRPTKYNSKTPTLAHDYIDECEAQNQIPYIEELALNLHVDDETLLEWAKKYTDFSAALKRLKIRQRICLYRATMQKNSATGAIFQLKVNHDKIEINRNELTGKDGKELPVPILGSLNALHSDNSVKKDTQPEEKN